MLACFWVMATSCLKSAIGDDSTCTVYKASLGQRFESLTATGGTPSPSTLFRHKTAKEGGVKDTINNPSSFLSTPRLYNQFSAHLLLRKSREGKRDTYWSPTLL